MEYSTEFERLHARATIKLQALQEVPPPPCWADEVKASEKLLQEMEQNRRQVQVQLRLELSGASGAEARQAWERRLQEWSKTISSLRGPLESLKGEQQRRSLNLPGGGVPGADYGAGSASAERQSARESTELMDRSTQKLEEARRQCLETENIGQGVLSDLAAQRETILHVRESMTTVSQELTAARRTIDGLMRAAQQNQMITLVVAFVLFVGLAFWGLMILGLPLKWNLFAAVGLVIVTALVLYLKRRLEAKRDAAREVASSSSFYHAA